jgi:hypothetical protein
MSEADRRPRLAAFPKGFFHQLIDRRELTIEDFIRRAPSLGLEGVELYPGFLPGTSTRTSHDCGISHRLPRSNCR